MNFIEIQFSKLKKKYPQKVDINGIPFYSCNWSENYMERYFYISIIVFALSYTAYIITEFCSASFKYLRHNKSDEKTYEKMNALFCGKPSVIFNCVCYHYETRTVYYTDSQGRSQTRTVTYRVNTHFDTFIVPYHSVRDVSGPFVLNIEKANIMKKDLIKLYLDLEITWADAISHSDYEEYKSDFIKRNENLDTFMDFSEQRTLPGFNAYNLIKLNEKCFINMGWYVLSIFLTLTQYYKWYLDSRSIHQKFKIIKLISTRYNLLQQEGYGNMQPSLDLITEQYNFDLSKTAYCEDKEVQLPSLEEVQQAMEKYSQQLPNLVVVNENGRSSVRNLREENYDQKLEIKNEDKENEMDEAQKIDVKNIEEPKTDDIHYN